MSIFTRLRDLERRVTDLESRPVALTADTVAALVNQTVGQIEQGRVSCGRCGAVMDRTKPFPHGFRFLISEADGQKRILASCAWCAAAVKREGWRPLRQEDLPQPPTPPVDEARAEAPTENEQ